MRAAVPLWKPESTNRQEQGEPAGLAIPELSDNAGDTEIFAAIESLDRAKKRLAGQRRSLAEKAQNILLSYSPGIQSAGTGEMTQESADQQSASVKEKLKTVTGRVTRSSNLSEL